MYVCVYVYLRDHLFSFVMSFSYQMQMDQRNY